MVKKFELSATHLELDDKLKKYITKKLGTVDKYMSRHIRPSAHLEVRLKGHTAHGQRHSVCDVTLHLPHDTIKIRESTQNIFASVDIVEAKLKQQIRHYKELHTESKRRRKLFARTRNTLPAADIS